MRKGRPQGHPVELSEDSDKAYLQGDLITVKEVRERYSLAISFNNLDILNILYHATRPMTTLELAKRIFGRNPQTGEQINFRMKKLFEDKLVVRMRSRRNILCYLMSEKGLGFYKKAKQIQEEEERDVESERLKR